MNPMQQPVTVIVKLKSGDAVTVQNLVGWDNFVANLVSNRAVIALGIYIPMDMIAIIHPPIVAGAEQPTVTTEGNVIHLHQPSAEPTPPVSNADPLEPIA